MECLFIPLDDDWPTLPALQRHSSSVDVQFQSNSIRFSHDISKISTSTSTGPCLFGADSIYLLLLYRNFEAAFVNSCSSPSMLIDLVRCLLFRFLLTLILRVNFSPIYRMIFVYSILKSMFSMSTYLIYGYHHHTAVS